nr:reverse transcriptase domain, zinc finger, CCHC-type, aspartic peptidase domain protein [Tanacetum cinerariifolium]
RTSKAKTEIIDLETIERTQAAGSSKEEIQKILNEVKRSLSPSEDILQDSQDPIPWILSFNYKKQEAIDTSPPLLLRQYSVKWWKQIDEKQADIKAVIDYHDSLIERSPRTSKAKTEIIDLETIERIQAAGSSKEEIQKILNEVKRSPSPSEDILQDSQDPYDDIEKFLNF